MKMKSFCKALAVVSIMNLPTGLAFADAKVGENSGSTCPAVATVSGSTKADDSAQTHAPAGSTSGAGEKKKN